MIKYFPFAILNVDYLLILYENLVEQSVKNYNNYNKKYLSYVEALNTNVNKNIVNQVKQITQESTETIIEKQKRQEQPVDQTGLTQEFITNMMTKMSQFMKSITLLNETMIVMYICENEKEKKE